MHASDYLDFTNTTAIYPGAGSRSSLELFYLSLGLASEAGEVAGKVKKFIRDGHYSDSELADELGDCFWYLVRLCKVVNMSPEEVMYKNKLKLLGRKENNTIQGSGDAR